MHKIFWDVDQVSMLTNAIEAEEHKHWMLQLFLSMGKPLQLKVEGKIVYSRCVLVANDRLHAFETGDEIHYSMLIEATSDLGISLIERYLESAAYCDLSTYITEGIEEQLKSFCVAPDLTHYYSFVEAFYEGLQIHKREQKIYDERIQEVFHYLLEHDLQGVTVKQLADRVYLSPSRLAHLFKEQTGIPLKSYLVLHKIYRAFSMLLQDSNITEASLMAGFDSPSHFASTSKAWTGTSPSMAVKDSEFLKVINFSS